MFAGALGWYVYACVCFPLRLILALPSEGFVPFFRRLLLFALLIPVYLLLNTLHLTGFILDELLFFGYRKTAIKQPLFIAGIPRSGTTYLHRVLAHDTQFTTLRTWEVLLAPSVSERWFYTLLGRILSPLGKFAAAIRTRLFRNMDAVHLFGLLEAEEDFFLLLWADHCFLSAFLCPGSCHYWNLGKWTQTLSASRRKRLLRYYDFCLRKHLYFHGQQLTLLSKNPSFTSLLPDLQEYWPDARFVFCTRAPEKVVASQLSSLRPAMTLIGNGRLGDTAQQQLLDILHGYYRMQTEDMSNRVIIEMQDIQKHTTATVSDIYRQFHLSIDDSMLDQLDDLQDQSRQYRTSHRYTLEDFGLDPDTVAAFFDDVWSPEVSANHD